MKRSPTVLYLLVILGLGMLALRPYQGKIMQCWQDFQQAWQLVRSGNPEPAEPNPAIDPSVVQARQREVITPDRQVATSGETKHTGRPLYCRNQRACRSRSRSRNGLAASAIDE